ncbi:MAG: hypothetical protein HY327_05465 [Chloroflexi bacterium]|nr:hypothetical protein [Chloroflexota bacterium]
MTMILKRYFVFITLWILAACAAPATPDPRPIQTSAAQTVIAQVTAQAPTRAPAPASPAPATIPPRVSPTAASGVQISLSVTDKYLMAFHACDNAATQCQDPRNHRTYLAQSNDGAAWKIVPNWTPFIGSVPDVIRRGNKLYVYNPGRVTRYNLETQTLEAATNVAVSGGEMFVDPSPTLDDKGRIVLFFLYGQIGGDPAGCLPGETSCLKRFGSATEVEGSDGTRFAVDAGDRASVTLSGNLRSASDPDIFFDGTRYYLYLSHGPSIAVWSATELRGTYTQITGLPLGFLSNNTGGIPAGHFDNVSARYWTYAHVQQRGVAVIRRAVHADFSRALNENDWTTVLSAASLGLSATTNVESPGLALNAP